MQVFIHGAIYKVFSAKKPEPDSDEPLALTTSLQGKWGTEEHVRRSHKNAFSKIQIVRNSTGLMT